MKGIHKLKNLLNATMAVRRKSSNHCFDPPISGSTIRRENSFGVGKGGSYFFSFDFEGVLFEGKNFLGETNILAGMTKYGKCEGKSLKGYF